MNERFSKILQQCTVSADQAEDYSKSNGLIVPDEKLDVAKFAELIVRECADLFPLAYTDEQYQRRIDKTILKHFGLYS